MLPPRPCLLYTSICYETDDHRLRDRFWGRVIFPVHTLSGKVVAFGGRVLSTATKGVKAVSYTHLDVYKRQKQSIAAITPLTKELKILGEYAEGKSNV